MDLLYVSILAVCAFFTVLVAAMALFFTLKHHGSLSLELAWTFIPFALSMVMLGWGASLLFR